MSKKTAKPKPKSISWTQGLDEQAVSDAFDDATVDAHDEDEQHSGLVSVIQDELAFPFAAKVLGEVVTVIDVEWPENDSFGLDFVGERNGARHRIDARSVDLMPPLPEGHLFLAAYIDWNGGCESWLPLVEWEQW